MELTSAQKEKVKHLAGIITMNCYTHEETDTMLRQVAKETRLPLSAVWAVYALGSREAKRQKREQVHCV